jgi:alkanesulfonate monooxygenase SsuD/methylene tetrahydromethanopterin reductase-like flavin-dependent oxidoreductase (luciferase family)
MKFGFIPTEGGRFFEASIAEVMRGEELGFDSVWLEEHHGVKNHYWPSPLVGLAAFGSRTSSILLGTDVIVSSFYHPVRLAEDAAMLDVITNGRFILGMAIGYRPEEFLLYDTPLEKRGARFEETVAVLKRLWTEDSITFEGKYIQLKNARIEPRPQAIGGVPLWLGGWGELSLKRAACFGDAWLPGPTASLEKLQAAKAVYERNLVSFGKAPENYPSLLTRDLIIAKTREEAYRLAEMHLLVSYRDEYGGGWSHPLIGKEDAVPVDQLEQLGQDRFIVGDPEDCINKIRRFQQTLGVDHLICRLYFPGMPHAHIMEELELLSKEVFPEYHH